MSKTELRVRSYGKMKKSNKLGFQGKSTLRIPDPDLDHCSCTVVEVRRGSPVRRSVAGLDEGRSGDRIRADGWWRSAAEVGGGAGRPRRSSALAGEVRGGGGQHTERRRRRGEVLSGAGGVREEEAGPGI